MKTGSDRKYTAEFRESAVKQVMEGRRPRHRGGGALAGDVEQDAGQLDLSARKGQALVKPSNEVSNADP
jgi:transposase-like protein